MRTSSAAQLEIDYSSSEPRSPNGSINVVQAVDGSPDGGTSGTPKPSLDVPNFGVIREVYAITSRLAGRINASNVSEHEHNALLRERQTLLDKKFNGTITRKEANRLEYVRWSLDRIEDAKYGQALDFLESSVAQYEQLQDDLRNLQAQLTQHKRGHR